MTFLPNNPSISTFQRKALCSLLFCVVASPSLWAQSVPDVVQEQRRQQERERLERERLESGPDVRLPGVPVLATMRLPRDESPCFVLQDIRLQGDAAAQFDWVLDALAGPQNDDDPRGLCVGAQGIALLTQRAQQALIGRGYVTSRLLVEPQDLRTGRLVLTFLPGRIHRIRFADGSSPRANAANALPAQAGDILNLRDIEQGLENLKRMPTAEADIQIEPAEVPGSSDLVIRWRQALPLRVSLSADDSGSQATGRVQGSATLSVDSPLGLNDLFYVALNHSLGGVLAHSALAGHHGQTTDGPRGTDGHTLHYSLPWGYWLLGVTHSQNGYHQSVAGANQTLVYSGTSSNSDVKLSRLLYRDQSNKTTVSLRAFQRTSNNYIDDTEVQVQRRVVGGWEAAVAQRMFIGASTLDASVAYKRGTGAFGARPAPEEAFGEGTSRLQLVNADVNLQSPFMLAGQKLRYSANGRAQWNQTPLTPQDRFAIGGRYTVRGFDGEASLAGERGWLLRQELAWAAGAGAELYAGIDHGQVGGPSTQHQVGRRLTGAVLGVRGGATALGSNLGYELFVGQPLRKPEGFRTAHTTAGFSLSLGF